MPSLLLIALVVAGSADTTTAALSDMTDAEVANQAEAAFREGVARRDTTDVARPFFGHAASAFTELQRRGVRNPTLYRNLGNAQFLAGDLPGAILSFRRGLRLSPGDADLRGNLAVARERVVYSSTSAFGRQPVEHRPPWLPYLRDDWLLYAAGASYVLACIIGTRWLMVRRGTELVFALALLSVSGGLTVWVVRHMQQQVRHPLVVIAEDGVLLRKGNNLAFPPRYDIPLNCGVEAHLLFARDDWLHIELAGGETGWAPRQSALVDDS